MLWPEQVAIVDTTTNEQYTYADLLNRAFATSGWLHWHGFGRNDRVAVLSHNGIHLLDLLFACARLRAVLVPLNWRLSVRELQDLVADTTPRVFFASPEFEPLARQISGGAKVHIIDGPSGAWQEVIGCTSVAPTIEARMSDPWLILYTGGTTGRPKGAVLTRGSMTWNSINTSVSWGLSRQDSGPVFTPAFHTGFWNVFTLPLLLVGGKVLVPPRFEPTDALRILVEERPSVCFMVPTMFQLVAEQPAFAKADLSSLRWAISGGAPLPQPVYERWRSKVPIFKQGYGLTEAGPNNFATPDSEASKKPGSVGRLTYFASARIVDANGNETPVDQPGELLLAGPHLCGGYWNKPEETAEAMRDGWLHTGDVARRDPDGYFYIVDRKKDMIITGGENVFPSEVEDVLYAHDSIRECAVVGVPDDVWGEAITAVVSLKPGCSVREQELLLFCKERLARYKAPKNIVVVDSLPVTSANKISRILARETAILLLREDAVSGSGISQPPSA